MDLYASALMCFAQFKITDSTTTAYEADDIVRLGMQSLNEQNKELIILKDLE